MREPRPGKDKDPATPDDTEPLVEPVASVTASVVPGAGESSDALAYDDDDELDDVTRFELFSSWLEGQQWVPVVVLIVGAGLLLYDPRIGAVTVGSAVILAGLVPVITGRYRGPFGTLRGFGARLRGLVSVIIGLVIISLGLTL